MTLSDDFPNEDGDMVEAIEVGIADQQAYLTIDAELTTRIVQLILADAGYTSGEISLAILDDPAIHELNRQYLNHDYPTDVLSFLLEDDFPIIQGEIIVSTETAIKCANEVAWDPNTELLLYVIHGTLHLVGHDDHEDSERALMRAKERHYLVQAGIEFGLIDGRLPDANQVNSMLPFKDRSVEDETSSSSASEGS